MQLTRHDGTGVIASRKAANLLARLVTRTLELRVYPDDRLTADLPNVDPATLTHLEDDGVARIGTEVGSGMVLIGRVSPERRRPPETDEDDDAAEVLESVDAAFGVQGGRDASLRCPPGLRGTIDSITMEDGAKKTDPRLIRVVVLSQYSLRLGDVLEANGRREVVTALTDDEDFELRWPGLEGAFEVTRVEPFAETLLHARSIGPYSVVSEMPLGGQENFGGQRVTTAQLDALLDRGAKYTVHELLTVKSDDVSGRVKLYESIVRGEPRSAANMPRRTRTLERLLLCLGFDVDLSWRVPRIKFLSGAALRDLAPGVVKKPETINYRTFRPERDGLFCEHIFGVEGSPERAVNVGRIEFGVPMMHPFARKPVAKLLDMTEERLERVLLSERLIDDREPDDDWRNSGAPALKAAAEAKDPSAARFFYDAWPVLPPALRPLIPLEGGRYATSDLNDLYRRVINRNNRTRRLIELNAPAIIIRNEVRMQQEALDALVHNGAFGRSIAGPDKSPLVSLAEFLLNERGSLRSVEKLVDYSGTARFVITPEERLHLPESMAYELFKPWLYERLEGAGHVTSIKEARREVETRSAFAAQALRDHAPQATLLAFSSSGSTPLGARGFEPWSEPVIGLGARMASRLGLRPGDAVVLHVAIDPRAQKEVLSLENASVTPDTQQGGWLERASRAEDPLDVLLNAALAEESDEVRSRRARLLLARLEGDEAQE